MIKKLLLVLLTCTVTAAWACDECDSGPLDVKKEDVEILVKANEDALKNWNSLTTVQQHTRIKIIVENIKVLLQAPEEAWTQNLINRAYKVTLFVDSWQQKNEK